MRNKMNYQVSVEEIQANKYVMVMAHWNDRFYEFGCPCGKELVGRTKSELLENFETHFKDCPSR